MTIRDQLLTAGYRLSPNNIHGLSGELMYAAGPGIPQPASPCDSHVQVLSDRIRVYQTKHVGAPYTRRSYTDTLTVGVFDSADSFLEYCRNHGKISEPGMPAFMYGD